eukprot:TRINITY_DN37137_c0_g1_i1.p1 TRINITY_DN37137_c0_g1~~TRINITY_DN37137_c0_g1_i1.p1  ORF type:complete len:476 (+),score=26.38 TRINITY_DN37137_c0_g1_i1:184-1611(+)
MAVVVSEASFSSHYHHHHYRPDPEWHSVKVDDASSAGHSELGGPELDHFADEDGMFHVGQLLDIRLSGMWKRCQIVGVDFRDQHFPYTLRFDEDRRQDLPARLDVGGGRCIFERSERAFRLSDSEEEASAENVIVDILGDSVLDLTEGQLIGFVRRATDLFHREHALLKVPVRESGIVIFGDLHGNFASLRALLESSRGCPPTHTLLFLGDYVDRGSKSLECLTLLLAWKLKYPDRVFLLRGNHEDRDINAHYGFIKECKTHGKRILYNHFAAMFSYMPLAAVVGDSLFCAHGGIGPGFRGLAACRALDYRKPMKIPRNPVEPWEHCIQHLTWADPASDGCSGSPDGPFDSDGFAFNRSRRCSVKWNETATERFLESANLSVIVRGHECVDGYRVSHGGRVVTVFSSSAYGGGRNGAAALHLAPGSAEIRVSMVDKSLQNVTASSLAIPVPVRHTVRDGSALYRSARSPANAGYV